MKFRGPAPEAINGRLAMAGIVWGAISEAKTGLPVADLFKNSTPQILLFAAFISYASLIPILKGARSEAFGARSDCPKIPLIYALAHIQRPGPCWCFPEESLSGPVHLPDSVLVGSFDCIQSPACCVPLMKMSGFATADLTYTLPSRCVHQHRALLLC